MLIETNAHKLTKQEMFKLALYDNIKAYKWFFIIIGIITVYALTQYHKDGPSRFMTYFGFIYPIFYVYFIYQTLSSKSNRIFYKQRTLTFNESKIEAILGGEDVLDSTIKSEYPYDMIIKKDRFKDYWLLYIAKGQYIPVPQSSFKNEQDLSAFIELINKKVK